MIINKEIRQANIASCYEMAAEAITECSGTLDFAISALERSMNEAELANDKRYTALCGVYESMREMIKYSPLKISRMEATARKNPALENQRESEGSEQRDQRGYEATEELYVRADLLSRFQNSPLLARVVVKASELERLCKTRIGRVYVSAYEWVKCSPQSLFGSHIS